VPAVVVRPAGGQQAAPLDQAGQGPTQAGVVLGMPDLDPVDPGLDGLVQHPFALAGGQPARVGQHRHPAGLDGDGDRVGHRDPRRGHIGRPARRQVAVERLGRVGHHPPRDHRPGEVGP
jgi:hypothetical protein